MFEFRPKVVTMVEWDADLRSNFFLQRFKTCIDFFANAFDSNEAVASRLSFGRRGFEERVLAREMVNLVACEGLQRLVRSESLSQLQQRMVRIGFAAQPFSKGSMLAFVNMLKGYPLGWSMRESRGAVKLCWKEKPIVSASAWRPL